jgi:hypothetical protein
MVVNANDWLSSAAAQLDASDRGGGPVVRQVAAGADGDFEDSALGAGAEPFPASVELDLLEEGDLAVVAGSGLVPDPLDLGPLGRWIHGVLLDARGG